MIATAMAENTNAKMANARSARAGDSTGGEDSVVTRER
jgi:hypothetical protein